MAYILIIMTFSATIGNHSFTLQEFSSKESCLAALAYVKEMSSQAGGACIEK